MKKKYAVTFTQFYVYHVEVDDEGEENLTEEDFEDMAYDQAFGEFEANMRCPIARLYYDDWDIEEE